MDLYFKIIGFCSGKELCVPWDFQHNNSHRLLQFINSPDLKDIMGGIERGVHSGYAEKVAAGDVYSYYTRILV